LGEHRTVRITGLGIDEAPSLSSDRRSVVFVRNRVDGKCTSPTAERGCSECEELWIVRSGSQPVLLLPGDGTATPSRIGMRRPTLSNLGDTVFFATGDCVGPLTARALDLRTMKETLLFRGGSLDHEVLTGPFAGMLVVVGYSSAGESWTLLKKDGTLVRVLPLDDTKRTKLLAE
jgi:hypothetical protein